MGWLNKNKKYILIFALIALALLVFPHLEFLSIDNIVGYAEISIWITALGFVTLYIIKGLAMVVPSSLMYIAAGLAFAPGPGILITYIGLAVSLSIGYFIGNRLGEEKVTKMISKQKIVSDYLSGNKGNLTSLCFMSRLLHLPFGFVSLFLGALNMPFFKYLAASLLGVTPIMIPTVLAGTAISNPLSAAFLIPFVISLAITLAILVAYKTKIVTKPRVAVFLILLQAFVFVVLMRRIIELLPILAFGTFIMNIVLVLLLVKQDKTSAYKVIWIIIIMALPMVGGVLYLLFGNSRPTKKVAAHIKEHALIAKLLDNDDIPSDELLKNYGKATAIIKYIQQASSYHSYENTESTYYDMGEKMFEDMLTELEQAEKFIFMEYFIISKSYMWDRILEILLQKSEKGVDVRLIFDDVGSLGLFNSEYVASLRKQGIKVMRFNPIIPLISPFMNNRNHRKILVIDGYTGFTGGINIADEYINLENRFGVWKDTGVMLKGDAVWSFTLMFIETWNSFSKKKNERIDDCMSYKYAKTDAEKTRHEVGLVVPFGDSPLGKERLGENIYIDILNRADNYVYIFTPYLIISEKMIYALQMAAKRGVDVRIITPGIADKKIIYRLTRSYYKYLLDYGVKIYEYTPGFLHAKSFVCDDEIAVVGTINLDYRSLYLHFECAALLYKTDTVIKVKEDALKTMSESREVLQGKGKRFYHELIDAVLHLFAPLT